MKNFGKFTSDRRKKRRPNNSLTYYQWAPSTISLTLVVESGKRICSFSEVWFKLYNDFHSFVFYYGCCKNLTMNIQDFLRTSSGPSCSFQNHIYMNVVLHHHEINQHITSKVYHDTYKFHQFPRVLKITIFLDFVPFFFQISILLYFVNFCQNVLEISIFVEIFQNSPFSSNFGKKIWHSGWIKSIFQDF